jgi:hypothetical protein
MTWINDWRGIVDASGAIETEVGLSDRFSAAVDQSQTRDGRYAHSVHRADSRLHQAITESLLDSLGGDHGFRVQEVSHRRFVPRRGQATSATTEAMRTRLRQRSNGRSDGAMRMKRTFLRRARVSDRATPDEGKSMSVEGKSRSGYIQKLQARLKAHPLAQVSPGLIKGVADHDPSGIATYSQAGAQFASARYGRCRSPSP